MNKKKIVYVPSDFITSERYYQNKSTVDANITDIEEYNINKWFMKKDNIYYLTKLLYNLYLNNEYEYTSNNKLNYKYFQKNIPIWMNIFVKNYNINNEIEEIFYIDNNYKHFISALSKINKLFLDEFYYKIKKIKICKPIPTNIPDWNPYKSSTYVGRKNEFEDTFKKMKLHDITYSAENAKEYDVWGDNKTIRNNNNFRNKNNIPIWQSSMNVRNYERDNNDAGGLQCNESLETIIRGYNMDDVYKYANNI